MKLRSKIFAFVLSTLFCAVSFCSCAPAQTNPGYPSEDDLSGNPKVRMTLSNDMVINLELYPDVAPITVANFLNLVDTHYYEGTIFHRVINDFMIQGGGFKIGTEVDLTYGECLTPVKHEREVPSIRGEFTSNGFQNDLKHEAGVLSMARSDDFDSATSQFFICSATCEWLDGEYAAFGRVTDEQSLKNVISISYTPRVNWHSFSNMPIITVYIVSMTRI